MPRLKPLPLLSRLRELFIVMPIPASQIGNRSGLRRRKAYKGRPVGSEAATLQHRSDEYAYCDWRVRVDGHHYRVARVVYFMTYERDPGNLKVSHVDGNILNNNAENLKLEMKGKVNAETKSVRRNNTSGLVGVSWNKRLGKWRVRLQGKYDHQFVGSFTCKLAAARAARDKYIEFGWLDKSKLFEDLSCVECSCGKCVR